MLITPSLTDQQQGGGGRVVSRQPQPDRLAGLLVIPEPLLGAAARPCLPGAGRPAGGAVCHVPTKDCCQGEAKKLGCVALGDVCLPSAHCAQQDRDPLLRTGSALSDGLNYAILWRWRAQPVEEQTC